jgi:hypothetical protein
MGCTIQFWHGKHCLLGLEDKGCASLEDASRRVSALLYELMSEDKDWTGCRFQVTDAEAKVVLVVPVLPTMSAIARQTAAARKSISAPGCSEGHGITSDRIPAWREREAVQVVSQTPC